MAATSKAKWPTCAACECCSGIALSQAGDKCLAHVDPRIRDDALGSFHDDGNLDARGVPFSGSLLQHVLRAAPQHEGRPRLGTVNFERAQFGDGVDFLGAQFGGDANFTSARFGDRARFVRVIFERFAWFGGATFDGHALFNGTQFREPRNLGPMVVHGTIFFNVASFSKPIDIAVSADRISMRRTTFDEGVQLRLRRADIILDLAEFGAPLDPFDRSAV